VLDDLEPHRKGDATEAAVITELKHRGLAVSVPFGDNERYDVAVESPSGEFYRCKIKTGNQKNGCVKFWGRSTHTNSTGQVSKQYCDNIDEFLVYSWEYEELFLIPVDAVGDSMQLRVEEAEKEVSHTNPAEQYQFDERWLPDESRDGYQRSVRSERKDTDSVDSVASQLSELGATVYITATDGTPHDLLATTNDGRAVTVTVRTAKVTDGYVFLSGNQHADGSKTRRETDHYVLQCRDRDRTLLIDESAVDAGISIWVDNPDRIDPSTKFAVDYELEAAWPPDDVPTISSKTPTGAVRDAFCDIDVTVAPVTGDDTPADLLAERPDGTFARVAAVPVWKNQSGCLRLKPDRHEGVDYYAPYDRDADACYLVAADAFDRSISLRVDDPDTHTTRINWADGYRLADTWPA
jgi:hypothetical protein